MKKLDSITNFKNYVESKQLELCDDVTFVKQRGGFTVKIPDCFGEVKITCYGGYQYDELIDAMKSRQGFKEATTC
ncbi:hypothetical protein HB943_02005 [Listeria weihenstephanensis]|uniref:Uncharacterized protein n=1 Tax=Listeria weihenstephanensis TaxID=1006155 RepID=A0A841Z279_9LIST|nr:hypothetical protein [Listeria weihenstephanensis]MBC1499360.1 hypothetical protein [Listeria weihenstephanensis]